MNECFPKKHSNTIKNYRLLSLTTFTVWLRKVSMPRVHMNMIISPCAYILSICKFEKGYGCEISM